jgi:hypothetical protein
MIFTNAPNMGFSFLKRDMLEGSGENGEAVEPKEPNILLYKTILRVGQGRFI